MFKRFQRFYTSIKVILDLVVVSVAFGLAYLTRFRSVWVQPEPPSRQTLISLLSALIIFPLVFHQARLYATNRVRSHVGEVFEIFKATIYAALILVTLTYFTRERYSRFTLGIFLIYSVVLVSVVRLALRKLMNELRKRGHNIKSILVIGAGELGRRVIETIHGHRELGFRVVGALTRNHQKVGQRIEGVPVVGQLQELGAVLDREPVDQVILALPIEDQALLKPIMDELASRTVDVKIVPDLYQYITLGGGFEEFGGLPIISLQGGPLQGWNSVAKRSFDILVSSIGIVLTSPLMISVALTIKLSSRGRIFYRQERMGMDGHTFRILKFRTMQTNAEANGAQMASRKDPRSTWVGALLRRLSFDELPQLFNVWIGDMSLVGPRPERPVFIEEFKRQIPRYHLRHKVKAGITGWAQVNGLRGQTSIEKRIQYDLYYIENWSLLLDIKILARTALGGFLSKNAY